MQIYISMQRGITRSIGEFIVWIFLHKFVSGVFITLSFPCSFYKLFNVFDLMYSRVNKGVGLQSRISWRVCWLRVPRVWKSFHSLPGTWPEFWKD